MKLFAVLIASIISLASPAWSEEHITRSPSTEIDNFENLYVLTEIDHRWRSSDRYIPGAVLLEQAWRPIGPALLHQLADMSPEELSSAVLDLVNVNKGVAENLFKIRQMARRLRALEAPFATDQDAIDGLLQPELNDLVRGLSDAPVAGRRPGEFNYVTHLMQRAALRSPLNNDLYNFRMAAGHFVSGAYLDHHVTYSLFSRGRSNRPFLVSMGQEQVLDMLENLRFSENDVQYLKKKLQTIDPITREKNVPDAFFDYLRTFRFKGRVRMVPVGTLIFPGEPILEVDGDPIEAQIVETLVIPYVNMMTNFGTKAARVVMAAHGIPVAEGGTRRGAAGIFSGLAAYLAGAVGTSNTETGSVFDVSVYGSAAHAWFGLHEGDYNQEITQLTALLAYSQLFPSATPPADTYGVEEGVRAAVRARGRDLPGLRLDSALPGKTKSETSRIAAQILRDLGYEVGRGGVAITYSDGIDEYEEQRMHRDGAEVHSFLVGGELAAPGDSGNANMVYKLTEVRHLSDGAIIDPMKFAPGKVGEPGRKQLWRLFEDRENGAMARDVITEWDEAYTAPEGFRAVPLLRTSLENGHWSVPRVSAQESRAYVARQIPLLSAELQVIPTRVEDARYVGTPYTVERSPRLRARAAATVARLEVGEHAPYRVGVYFGSFDPVHEGHVALIRNARIAYGLDEVIVVPTGDSPALSREKHYRFNASERTAMLQRALRHIPGVRIHDTQTSGRTRFAIDSMAELEAEATRAADSHKPRMSIIGGEDLMADVGTWHRGSELLTSYSWIVGRRDGGEGRLAPALATATGYRVLSPRHLVAPEGNRTIELLDTPGLISASSTALRARYAGVQAIFHEVDALKTFWQGMHGVASGPLAVAGSIEITPNVAALKRLAFESDAIKVVATKDSHTGAEVRNAHLNSEFHPTGAHFPAHAMRGLPATDPQGDSRIPEVEVFPANRILTVPHMNEGADGASLDLVPFDVQAHADQILDPRTEVLIEKTGEASYDFFVNPRSEQIYDRLNPHRSIPIYVYGVATDFCVKFAALSLARAGHQVFIIEDAIAAVFPQNVAAVREELAAAGVRFVRTADVLAQFGQCKPLLEPGVSQP